MATTDSGFQFKRNVAGRTSGIQMAFTIANSATITVGDAVQGDTSSTTADGCVKLAGAGGLIAGIVVGLTDSNGIDLGNTRQTADWTYTASTKTVTVASDNETVAKVKALVDVDPMSVWSAQPDAAIGTTTSSGSSDEFGSYTDLVAASDQPDENNAGNAFSTKAQLFIWGRDPENTARGLYSIAEHQIWGA